MPADEVKAPSGAKDPRERTGVFTSGIVSRKDGRDIALFFTGKQHAGENLADVLRRRAAELDAPIQMCDALSRNLPEDLKVILCNCTAHYLEFSVIWSRDCLDRAAPALAARPPRTTRHNSGPSQGRQEGKKLGGGAPPIGRPAVEARPLPERLEHLTLHLEIACEVSAGGRDARVSEVVADYAHVNTRLEKGHRAAVPAISPAT
jgi:hypothetical protein